MFKLLTKSLVWQPFLNLMYIALLLMRIIFNKPIGATYMSHGGENNGGDLGGCFSTRFDK